MCVYKFVYLMYIFLYVSDNKLTCDCRLAWMFDLRARTKNIDIRRAIESISCSISRPSLVSHDIPDASQYNIENPYPITEYDEMGNVLAEGNHQNQMMFHRKESATSNNEFHTDKNIVLLMHIGVDNLPCLPVQDTDPTELPLPRESIGLDLSWLSSINRATSLPNQPIFIWSLSLTIITISYCTFWRVS